MFIPTLMAFLLGATHQLECIGSLSEIFVSLLTIDINSMSGNEESEIAYENGRICPDCPMRSE